MFLLPISAQGPGEHAAQEETVSMVALRRPLEKSARALNKVSLLRAFGGGAIDTVASQNDESDRGLPQK